MSYSRGFALPTVMIASIVMLMVLLSGLVAVSSVNSSLRSQYYERLTKEAAESGVAMADMCLAKYGQVPQWSDAKPLQPNTDCMGNVLTTPVAPSLYILDTLNLKTSFTVGAPIDQNGAMRVNVTATLYKYRTSGAGPPQTQTEARSSLVGGLNTFSNVAFGYSYNNGSLNGAQFAVILPTGDVNAVGANMNGRLGNGTTTDALTPTKFGIPASEKGISAYTSFLSGGYSIFVITQSGKVFGSGMNNNGQLGTGTTTNPVTTPIQFQLPAGVKAKFVSTLQDATFVLGDDNNIYSAGLKDNGQIGNSCSTVPCSPSRVLLPTPSLSDPNTLPVVDPGWVQPTNITADYNSGYVRMQGGAVYGWGLNNIGQLGNGTLTNSSTPVKIGSFGDAGQPKAAQINTDGVSLYVIDSNGDAWTTGYNAYGEAGGAATELNLPNGYCMDVPGANFTNGVQMNIYSCNRGAAQKYEFWTDGAVHIGGKCLDNQGNVNANGNPIQLWDCNGGVAQQWAMNDGTALVNPATGRCIDNSGNIAANANKLILYDCNGGDAQKWSPAWGSYTPVKIPKPPGVNKFVKVTTDQYCLVLLDDSGRAWSSGMSEYGQLGTGSTTNINMYLKQVVGIPAGSKIVDFYNTKYATAGAGASNTYFVLDDGSVYGAGSNGAGQLGDGTTTNRTTPVKMILPPGTIAKTVQSGYGTTVILTSNGKLYTVGNNSNGQLGDGTTTNSSTPKANVYTNQRTTIRY